MSKLFRFLMFLSFAIRVIMITGCGSSNMALNSAQKTRELQPGMYYYQVEALLGKPRSSQMHPNRVTMMKAGALPPREGAMEPGALPVIYRKGH